jgi:hypothetical protein
VQQARTANHCANQQRVGRRALAGALREEKGRHLRQRHCQLAVANGPVGKAQAAQQVDDVVVRGALDGHERAHGREGGVAPARAREQIAQARLRHAPAAVLQLCKGSR